MCIRDRVIDAMDILRDGRADCFCLVASDGDYSLLAQRIREAGLKAVSYTHLDVYKRQLMVHFKGQLREEQAEAVRILVQHDQGILNGTTAFGKTVTAIGLIAERKVNTLILVHTRTLLEQ